MKSRFLLHAARIADAVVFWPLLAFVVWGELVIDPASRLSLFFERINDKLVHFSAYFLLSFTAALALRTRPPVVLSVTGLIVLGGIIEILQGIVGRDMSIFDEMANAAGAILGAVLARSIVEPLRARLSPRA